jgi:hypothetical protein
MGTVLLQVGAAVWLIATISIGFGALLLLDDASGSSSNPFLYLGGMGWFLCFVLSLAGRVFCCLAPPPSAARGPAVASLALIGAALVLAVFLTPALGVGEHLTGAQRLTSLAGLVLIVGAALAGELVFLYFWGQVGTALRAPELRTAARNFCILFGVLVLFNMVLSALPGLSDPARKAPGVGSTSGPDDRPFFRDDERFPREAERLRGGPSPRKAEYPKVMYLTSFATVMLLGIGYAALFSSARRALRKARARGRAASS